MSACSAISADLRAAAVELATLEWVAWFNAYRLHGALAYIPPAEAEANYYRSKDQNCPEVVST